MYRYILLPIFLSGCSQNGEITPENLSRCKAYLSIDGYNPNPADMRYISRLKLEFLRFGSVHDLETGYCYGQKVERHMMCVVAYPVPADNDGEFEECYAIEPRY